MSLEKLITIAKVNPLEVIGGSLLAVFTGIGAVTVFQSGELNISNIASFATAGMAGILVKYTISHNMKEYKEIGSLIKQYGFNNEVMSDNQTRWVAKVYAKENNLLDEYNQAEQCI